MTEQKTFDRMSYHRYEIEKAAWLRAHPNATADQIERAFRNIARKLGL